MSLRLRPHQNLKDSQVPWLGQIPEHWGVLRSKYVFSEVDVRSATGQETHLSMSQKHGLIPSSQIEERRLISESYVGAKVCQQGDVVLNRLKAHLGVFALATQGGLVSPDYTVFRPRSHFSPRYFVEALRTPLCRSELRTRAKGIVEGFWRLYTEDFHQIALPIPPQSEQERIVSFVSGFNRMVRRLIRSKRRLIELLNEQKQVIVHRAVTRGLDPNVRQKSSGIKWLGDVPDHWLVLRLKNYLLEPLANGLFKKKDAYGSGVPLVNVKDIYQLSFCVQADNLEKIDATEPERRRYHVRPGDIFFVRSSLKLEGTGRAAFVSHCDDETVFECHVVRARPNDWLVIPRFLAILLNSYVLRHSLISRANTVTMSTIAQGVFSALPIWTPPLDEQTTILDHIDLQSKPLDDGIISAQRQIDLLREYRTRLIADLVTGKLDVRGVELPALGESEVLDDLDPDNETEADEMDDIEEAANEDE